MQGLCKAYEISIDNRGMLNGSDSMFPVNNNRSAAAFLKRKDCSAWISNGLQDSQWWRFPKSWGYPKSSSKSLDYDLVLKQPWWPLGIPHDSGTPHI